MAAPTATDLTTFVGKEVPEDQAEAFAARAEAVIAIVSAMASSYTRGKGFTGGEPNNDVRAVILTASARLLTDTSQITSEHVMGPFSVRFRNGFEGWTVNELYVLNRYRERAR